VAPPLGNALKRFPASALGGHLRTDVPGQPIAQGAESGPGQDCNGIGRYFLEIEKKVELLLGRFLAFRLLTVLEKNNLDPRGF